MAQRRAKREQEEQEHRKHAEQEKRKDEEEKRLRRKSQLEALKQAMVEIKESEPPVSPSGATSLQKAAMKSKPLLPPLQILTRKDRPPSNNIRQTGAMVVIDSHDKIEEQKTSLSVHQGAVPPQIHEYSFTVGAGQGGTDNTMGELQPNGTVKFSGKKRNDGLDNGPRHSEQEVIDFPTEDTNQESETTIPQHQSQSNLLGHEVLLKDDAREQSIGGRRDSVGRGDDESSLNSNRSRNRGGRRRASGRGRGRGRGGGIDLSERTEEELSEASTRSRGKRGNWKNNRGGGGRGRAAGDSSERIANNRSRGEGRGGRSSSRSGEEFLASSRGGKSGRQRDDASSKGREGGSQSRGRGRSRDDRGHDHRGGGRGGPSDGSRGRGRGRNENRSNRNGSAPSKFSCEIGKS